MTKSLATVNGIEISQTELFRVRPEKHASGFAPSGKVNTHQWGSNRSHFIGLGMEFAESRVYQAGDDVKNIDWRVTARTGQTHTKLYQEERERPVHILLDLRSMMHFGSRNRFKSHLAAEIAAKVAWIAHDGGDRVGGLICHKQGCSDFRASRTRRSLLRLLDNISQNTRLAQEVNQESSLAMSIRRLRHHARSGGLVFIISDFSDLDDKCEGELKKISARNQVTLIHIEDPFDARLPLSGGRLSDGQSVLSLSALSPHSEQEYRLLFSQRLSKLEGLCRQYRMVLQRMSTIDDPSVLFATKYRKNSRRAI
ncbi:hypothetical protein MACH09_44780 [Vibrio sp. MACH09]|uniref:DUF58 domain-containing protein n=1 Tax=Vibrio sp. MACH09 TaxID=3025122 RepID=UPI00278EF11E|nr:DUF58 domain-containing protein [Vibrio sp. MACH09]GLO63970.1 hypothetical protein MACH09_44780 [Vibrio sp. MACH09]